MKIATIVGARPQFVKAAPLSWLVRGCSTVDEVLIATGQHFDYEMAQVFFDDLDLRPPDWSLGVHGGTHGEMTGRMLERLEAVLVQEDPDWAVVYGDTNSTLAAALAAAKLGVPLAHVESGLRSFRRSMPEEINRVVTDHLATRLYCPTTEAMQNLSREGLEKRSEHVGDVMFDVCLRLGKRAEQESDVLERLELDGNYSVATIHRQENTDDAARLRELVSYLNAVDTGCVVMPLHPRTEAALAAFDIDSGKITKCPPLGYIDMARLVRGATAVYTDSGGLQKEAYFHGVPCVTLRDETEWIETVANGWNRLWSTPNYLPRQPIREYGAGHAAELILHSLLRGA